jgi:hypothetical protein
MSTTDGYLLDGASINELRRVHQRLRTLETTLQKILQGQATTPPLPLPPALAARVKDGDPLPARDNSDETTDSASLELLRSKGGDDTKYSDVWSNAIDGVSMSSMPIPSKARGIAIKEPWGDWLFMPWIHIEHVKLTTDLNSGSTATGKIWRRIDGVFTDTTIEVADIRCQLLTSGTISSGKMTVCVVFPDGFPYVIAAEC